MKNLQKYILLACASLPLAACGEGYEMQLVKDYFPYGNERTAGSGVAYVLAKILPEKELKLEPVAPKIEPAPVVEAPPPPPAPEPAPVPIQPPEPEWEPVQSMEETFRESMIK